MNNMWNVVLPVRVRENFVLIVSLMIIYRWEIHTFNNGKSRRKHYSHIFILGYSKIWLVWNSGDKKLSFWIMKNLCNSNKKTANNLLSKLVLVLSVWYVIASHSITVTNYHFKWCSVIFNTVKPLSIISEGTAKNDEWGKRQLWQLFFQIIWGELYENYHYRADFSFKLQLIKVF
jgi:hypothetical protein